MTVPQSNVIQPTYDNEQNNHTNNVNDTAQAKKKITSLTQYKENMYIHGHIIKKIYFCNAQKNYIIIKSKDEQVMVFGGAPIEIEHLLAECKYLTSSLKFSSRSSIEIFDYQRAVAINSYLLGEIDTSKKILLSLLNKLHERKILTKKLWYIGIFLIVTIFMIFLSIYLEHFKYVSFLKIATFGSIGGFISLNLKLQKVKFEVSESTLSYIFVSIYKVVFCMLTSIISYFLIKSDLILGVVQANSNSDFFIYAIATLAGFSESLLPNIFKSIESSTYDNDNKNESKTDINSDNGFGI